MLLVRGQVQQGRGGRAEGRSAAGRLAGTPSDISAAELAKKFGEQVAAPTSSNQSEIVARDGVTCKYDNTHIWTSLNATGTQGQQGYTGVGVWASYSSTFDNQVSSFHASRLGWQSRWHDYAGGLGAYYGGGDPCYYVVDLRNIYMTDGGTANDRFSSFGDW